MDSQTLQQNLSKIIDVIKSDVGTIRTGRATPSLVENIMINAYGGSARLRVMELATIMTSDPQTLVITPFDKSTLDDIQKGIMDANVGLTPSNDGNLIRISIPNLTQERREELIKAMRQKLENGKIMIRQARHDELQEIKKSELSEDETSRLEKEVQTTIDNAIELIDSLGKQKEAELLQL